MDPSFAKSLGSKRIWICHTGMIQVIFKFSESRFNHFLSNSALSRQNILRCIAIFTSWKIFTKCNSLKVYLFFTEEAEWKRLKRLADQEQILGKQMGKAAKLLLMTTVFCSTLLFIFWMNVSKCKKGKYNLYRLKFWSKLLHYFYFEEMHT